MCLAYGNSSNQPSNPEWFQRNLEQTQLSGPESYLGLLSGNCIGMASCIEAAGEHGMFQQLFVALLQNIPGVTVLLEPKNINRQQSELTHCTERCDAPHSLDYKNSRNAWFSLTLGKAHASRRAVDAPQQDQAKCKAGIFQVTRAAGSFVKKNTQGSLP